MKLYIANGTHQNIDFQYRVPGAKNYRQQTIPIGGQQQLSGDLDQTAIDSIVAGYHQYGICRSNELSTFKGFHVPFVYSVDKPVPFETIAELVVHNREVQTLLGKKIRTSAALAVNSIIEENITGEPLKNFEITIEEKGSKDKDATVHEGVRVTRDRNRGAPQNARNNKLF